MEGGGGVQITFSLVKRRLPDGPSNYKLKVGGYGSNVQERNPDHLRGSQSQRHGAIFAPIQSDNFRLGPLRHPTLRTLVQLPFEVAAPVFGSRPPPVSLDPWPEGSRLVPRPGGSRAHWKGEDTSRHRVYAWPTYRGREGMCGFRASNRPAPLTTGLRRRCGDRDLETRPAQGGHRRE